jgi:hypothetical protein
MGLHRLLYASEAALDDGEAGLAELMSVARMRNEQLGLTGALLHAEGMFVQVLEGDTAELERVFESICADGRHRGMVLRYFAPVTSRLFAAWHSLPASVLTRSPEAIRTLGLGVARGEEAPAGAAVQTMRRLAELAEG